MSTTTIKTCFKYYREIQVSTPQAFWDSNSLSEILLQQQQNAKLNAVWKRHIKKFRTGLEFAIHVR